MDEEHKRIETEKAKLIESASQLKAEEESIAQDGQAIQTESGVLNEMQEKLGKLVAAIQEESTGIVQKKELAKQAEALQNEFNEKVKDY